MDVIARGDLHLKRINLLLSEQTLINYEYAPLGYAIIEYAIF
jgi:hypothetical protein